MPTESVPRLHAQIITNQSTTPIQLNRKVGA